MFPTIKDVAERAGVSPSTVSRVIADHPRISRATKERVRAVMRELNYHPNAVARSLVRRRTQTIGVALSRSAEAALANPFFPEVLRGIGSFARQARYSLTLTTATTYDEERQQCMELLTQRRVDGLIVLASRIDDPLVDWLAENGYPFVVLGRVPGREVPHVNNDNTAAARRATEHLLEHGHRRIGFVGGPPDLIVSVDRLEGYKQALEAAGIPVRPEFIVSTDFSYEQSYEAARRLLAPEAAAQHTPPAAVGAVASAAGVERAVAATGAERAGAAAGVERAMAAAEAPAGPSSAERTVAPAMRPDGAQRPTTLVAIDDAVALGVLAAARDLGLRVPEDVSVLGFNDSPVCPHVAPPLSSVSIPVFEMGVAAARMLCELLEGKPGPAEVILPAELVVRASTGPAPAERPPGLATTLETAAPGPPVAARARGGVAGH